MTQRGSLKQIVRPFVPSAVLSVRRRAMSRLSAIGRRIRQRASLALRKQLERRAGLLVARQSDYYSPLPAVEELRQTIDRWNRPSSLRGIRYDLEQMQTDLAYMIRSYYSEFAALPPYTELSRAGFGPGYTPLDALTLYLMVRHLKPRRYLEVGSGLSTYYCSLAAERNSDEGHPVQVTCIEPYPYPKVRSIPDVAVRQMPVQDVELSAFSILRENDILFIDSSHAVKIDGDVPYLYLEVLPTLERGVRIHIHDVPFPYNVPYPPQYWVFGQEWPMFWNEAMMVQALLSGNRDFEIVMSTPLLRHFNEPFLADGIPIYESVEENPNTFSSLWLKKAT